MKYRITTNGLVFHLERKAFIGWQRVNSFGHDHSCHPMAPPRKNVWDSEDGAEEAAKVIWGTSGQRIKKWRTV